MRRQVLTALVLSGAAFLGGCSRGRKDNLEKVLRDRVQLINEMAEVLEAVSEESPADEVRARLEELLEKQGELDERQRNLGSGDLSPQALKRLGETQRQELMASLTRLEKAREQALKVPAVAEAIGDLPLPRLGAEGSEGD
jgi:hypothetical protein